MKDQSELRGGCVAVAQDLDPAASPLIQIQHTAPAVRSLARCRCTWRGCGVGGRAGLFKIVQAKKPKLRFPSFMGQLVRSGAAGVRPVKVASCKSRAASYATNTSQQRSPLASQTVKVAASTAAFDAGIGVFATSALLQRGKGAKPTSTVDFGNIQNAKVLLWRKQQRENEKACYGNPQDTQRLWLFVSDFRLHSGAHLPR